MDINTTVFQEPRGVMRLLQFIFSICAFGTTSDYTGFVDFKCIADYKFVFEYPFKLELLKHHLNVSKNNSCDITINADFSSDSKFFVATGVIAMIYAVVIIVIYTKFDNLYKNNNQVPLIDFILSVIVAVLWLSSSAAWANALTGIKHVTDPDNLIWKPGCKCPVMVSQFTSLDISVILGFLNFFLWAADLWFLYKETPWFQNAPPSNTNGGKTTLED